MAFVHPSLQHVVYRPRITQLIRRLGTVAVVPRLGFRSSPSQVGKTVGLRSSLHALGHYRSFCIPTQQPQQQPPFSGTTSAVSMQASAATGANNSSTAMQPTDAGTNEGPAGGFELFHRSADSSSSCNVGSFPVPVEFDRPVKHHQWGPDKYKLVKFVAEDIRAVMEEVPEVKYYYIGDPNPQDYPFKDITLDTPIDMQTEKPPIIPKPNSDLQFSRLENGLRMVSLDCGGYLCSLGLFIDCGSRWEDDKTTGVCSFIEDMAFQATAHLSWLRTTKTLEALGVNAGCSAGREHMVYHADFERKYLPIIIPLLTGNVVFPRFLSWDMDRKKKQFAAEKLEDFANNVEAQFTELLHMTAWSNNTLGNRLFPHPRNMDHYSAELMRNFMMTHFSPDRMLLVAVNADHQDLEKWTMRAFVDYETVRSTPRKPIPAQYTGGECRVDANTPLSHLAIGFETPGGWNSPDLVTLTVLQTIMGGGGSFSTGGPGKGMYTRLYLEVLSTNWVESCVAFNTQYSDSGIFGLYTTAPHDKAHHMVDLKVYQLKRMTEVSREELMRAKNSLKSSIWMNLENRSVVMEDVARQLLMSGRVLSGADMCQAVDAVTTDDIKRAVNSMLSGKPTVVAYGDISKIQKYESIVERLNS